MFIQLPSMGTFGEKTLQGQSWRVALVFLHVLQWAFAEFEGVTYAAWANSVHCAAPAVSNIEPTLSLTALRQYCHSAVHMLQEELWCSVACCQPRPQCRKLALAGAKCYLPAPPLSARTAAQVIKDAYSEWKTHFDLFAHKGRKWGGMEMALDSDVTGEEKNLDTSTGLHNL